MNGTIQNIKVTSVILETDFLHPNEMHLFRCPKDGEVVTQYMGGDVKVILPGGEQAILPTFQFCKRCKTRYMFHSIA